jgi:hypothetical protein
MPAAAAAAAFVDQGFTCTIRQQHQHQPHDSKQLQQQPAV